MGSTRVQAPWRSSDTRSELEPVTVGSRPLWKDAERVASVPSQERPTQQPATWGQDMQECGFLSLPQHVQLAPKLVNTIQTAGVWESSDGAAFARWSQEVWPWTFENWSVEMGSKLFIMANPVESMFRADELSVLSERGMALPRRLGFKPPVVFKDCNGVPMYATMENAYDPYIVEIYNRYGQFVAGSERSDETKNQMRFHDEVGAPIAVATKLEVGSTSRDGWQSSFRRSGQPPRGALDPWEVQFFDSSWTNSSLAISQNRWVITAAVQEHALEASGRAPGLFLNLMSVALVLLLLAAVGCVVFVILYGTWRMVFPRSRRPQIKNIYLEDVRIPAAEVSTSSMPSPDIQPSSADQEVETEVKAQESSVPQAKSEHHLEL